MKINKNFLWMKLYYFCFSSGTVPVVPYIPIIAKSIGYSTTTAGALLTTVPILSLLTKPLFGSIADKFSIHKPMFLLIIAVNALCFFNIQWVATVPLDRTVSVECSTETNVFIDRPEKLGDECYRNQVISAINGTTVTCQMDCYEATGINDTQNVGSLFSGQSFLAEVEYSPKYLSGLTLQVKSLKRPDGSFFNTSCPVVTSASCSLLCSDETLRNLIAKPDVDEKLAPYQSNFWIYALLVICGRVAMFNALTIGDTICLRLLGDKTELFGHQRSFGAAGWGLMGFFVGLITDWYSRGKEMTDYGLCWYLSVLFFAGSIIFGSMLKYEKEVKSAKLFSDVKKAIAKNPQFILFLVTSIFLGAYSGLVWNFLIWYVEEIANEDVCADKSWIKTLQGIILFFHTFIGEIPFFTLSGWMMKRMGHTNCIALVAFTFCVRFIGISLVPNPWWLLPIEVCHGINYATYSVASATYANKVAPPGTQATVQGIVASVFDGLGIAIGTLISGIIIDNWGARACFFYAGVSAGVLFIVYFILKTYLAKAYPEEEMQPVKTTE